MNFHLSSDNLKRLKEYKPMLRSGVKIVVLFVAALYLLGFTLFPLLGVGNYQLVRVDALLAFRVGYAFLLKCGAVRLEFPLFGKIIERKQVKKPRYCNHQIEFLFSKLISEHSQF